MNHFIIKYKEDQSSFIIRRQMANMTRSVICTKCNTTNDEGKLIYSIDTKDSVNISLFTNDIFLAIENH